MLFSNSSRTRANISQLFESDWPLLVGDFSTEALVLGPLRRAGLVERGTMLESDFLALELSFIGAESLETDVKEASTSISF